jgi:hypothetical protein
MRGLLKRLVCGHSHVIFVRQTYGDENNIALDLGGRYIWRCLDCGQLVNKPYGPPKVDG